MLKKAGTAAMYLSGAIVISVFFYLIYSGIFSEIKIEEKKLGPYTIAYEDHKGPYSKIAPVMDSVYKRLQAEGINSTTGIGIYYDNPANTAEADLRSKGGCVIPAGDSAKFEKVKAKFNAMDIPAYRCVTLEFPMKSKVSILIAIVKGYPKIKKYIEENKIKPIDAPFELYENEKKLIIAFPVEKV